MKTLWLSISIFILFFTSAEFASGKMVFKALTFDLQFPSGHYMEETPGVAVSPDGQVIYVFNRGKHQLMAFTPKGEFIREIGHGIFTKPHGLRVDNEGNIWTTDTGTHMVIKFSPEGKILMVFGKKGTASEGWFHRDYNFTFLNAPNDVAFDEEGNIYIADGGNFRIVKYSKQGDLIMTFGQKGDGPGQFNFPHNLVVDPTGRLLVADRENKRIQIFNRDGVYKGEWNEVGYPYGLTLDSAGNVWMTDARAEQLVKLSPEGKPLARFGAPGKKLGHYRALHGITPFRDGFLVSDVFNWKVEFVRVRSLDE